VVNFNDPVHEKVLRAFHDKMIWTRFGTIFLGLWLLASPETFGYIHTVARWSDWISGFLLLLIGLLSINFRTRGWIWGGCFIGIWLQFAPLILWAQEPVIYVNDTLIGVLAIAFCVLVPLRPKELEMGPQIPTGWTYNPSSWPQRIPVILFAVIGWFIARYLASYQLGYIHFVWDPFFGLGTQKVITSMISQDFPVSDAGLGALAYSLEAIMGAKGGVRRWHTMPWIVVIFGILVVPLGFISIMLVMLQPIAVGAWCGLCLIIAFCMLIMLSLTVDEVVAVLQYLRQAGREGKPFWHTFWYGSSYVYDSLDTRTPTFHAAPKKIFQSMVWGVTIPWNLVLTALLGIWLLFSNHLFGFTGVFANSNDVCGALLVVFSVVSWAEVIRVGRFVNMFIALGVIAAAFFAHAPLGVLMHHLVLAGVVILLSIPRGKIREKYGSWDKRIR